MSLHLGVRGRVGREGVDRSAVLASVSRPTLDQSAKTMACWAWVTPLPGQGRGPRRRPGV